MGDTVDADRDDRPWTAQPAPIPVPNGMVVHDVAAAILEEFGHTDIARDVRERGEYGARKYGTPLQVDNGRDPLADAYEEALDAFVYLAQQDMRTGRLGGWLGGDGPDVGQMMVHSLALVRLLRAALRKPSGR